MEYRKQVVERYNFLNKARSATAKINWSRTKKRKEYIFSQLFRVFTHHS